MKQPLHSATVFILYVLAVLGPRPTPAHTLDRIDPNGHYAIGNLRWATPAEQSANRRPRVRQPQAGE